MSSLWDLLLSRLPPDLEVPNPRYVCILPSVSDSRHIQYVQISNTTSSVSASPQKRKRSAVDDELPDRPPEEMESAKCGNFDFKEVLVEDLLRLKSTVINRAPIMTAWATIVAERLGFEREESLSIGECALRRSSLLMRTLRAASVYTEMNAVSKAVSIGVHSPNKGEGTQEPTDGSQPYVNLMGRR